MQTGALNMANQKMPDYETIRAAVAGEKWAVAKVVECYQDEINKQATVRKRQPDNGSGSGKRTGRRRIKER